MFSSSYSLVALLGLAVSLPISTSFAAYLEVKSPSAGDHWYANERYKVTWDTDSPPSPIKTPYGAIYVVDSVSYQPVYELASNVKLADGYAWVQAPYIETQGYKLAVIGEVTQHSPEFYIVGTGNPE